ncbi:MAG: hypothetical protein DI538_30280, partial [Azospira oryzae]
MRRRNFLRQSLMSAAGIISLPLLGEPMSGHSSITSSDTLGASKLKITRIRYYSAPGYTKPLFNQARGIVEIQTDGGITGI